jgi:ribosome-associated protein
MIQVNDRLNIPEEELSFAASRGGGPGGQHVNKVASRITLRFDVANSPSLSDDQRQRLLSTLAPRLTRDGVLMLSSHESRSQVANREEVMRRFAQLLREGLVRPKKRRPTRPTRGSRERRIESKKRRSGVKHGRGKVRRGDDG